MAYFGIAIPSRRGRFSAAAGGCFLWGGLIFQSIRKNDRLDLYLVGACAAAELNQPRSWTPLRGRPYATVSGSSSRSELENNMKVRSQ